MNFKQNRFLQTCALIVIFLTSANISSAAEFVGTEQCIDCHQDQYKAWQGSHHEKSMQHANDESMLGDFDNAIVEFEGKNNKFFRKDKQFWVNIEGPDGKFHDYQIKYTFAYTPLQQYMVEFDDGRVQLIPFAWDSRSKDEGGQRWFHLYPDATKNHQEFYWTNTGQNWNYMCSDCHSTNVEKNFDSKTNTYDTSFSEINVGCEACHGPASDHITWSKSPAKSNEGTHKQLGFERNIIKSVSEWVLNGQEPTFKPKKIDHTDQTLVCAQCHSRHVQISEQDHIKTQELGDRYLMGRINQRLYQPDGQIYDEVFVYGSFLQSKMAQSGVVCSNCHDPHSAKLTMPEEVVCLQCHKAEVFATKDHHNHPKESAGAQCTNCHMPETTYMEVDQRRDHNWHVPRPDLSLSIGVKDSCLSCHDDKDSTWSDEKVQQWFPESERRKENHFGPVFAAADLGYQNVAAALSHIAQNEANAPIIRASALDRMQPFVDTNTIIAVGRGAKHSDTNVRIGAINGAKGLKGPERWRVVAPLLKDEVLAVRTEAALALIPLWFELSDKNKGFMQPALDEYMAIQTFNADRGFAHNNKGNVYAYQSKFKDAEQAYKAGIEIEPYFANSYSNLAEMHRRQNNNEASITVLQQGIKAIPDNAALPYSLGLAYFRAKNTPLAIEYFSKATKNAPNNAQYLYVYGLSLQDTEPGPAQKALRKAYDVGGNPEHLYALCQMQVQIKNVFQATQCINELRNVAPANVISELEQQLKQ
ncbi:tetratricopeptide repeat protein [Colwelliaceae bacterium BS250]